MENKRILNKYMQEMNCIVYNELILCIKHFNNKPFVHLFSSLELRFINYKLEII